MKSFNEIYENVYRDSKYSLEMARKEALTGNIIAFIIIGIIAIILTVMTQSFAFLMLGIVVAMFYYGLSKKNREYTKLFKQQVIERFVKQYNPNLNYAPYRGISRGIYNQGEFEHYDIFSSEDSISGILEGGHAIVMAEVHTEDEYTDSDGDTKITTLFHGLFAQVNLRKLVDANIKIRKDKLLFEGKNKVEMDSGAFEKTFTVFSTDKIIAMQLLTADIMQMLLDFKEKNKATPEITIKEDRMYIRFDTGDVFEANMLKDSLDFDTLLKYYNIINFTLELTEKLIKNIKETEL